MLIQDRVKEILIVKNAHFSNTKLRKYAIVFTKNNYALSYIGWKRNPEESDFSEYYKSIRFLHSGGGYGTNKIKLSIKYLIWMTKLFVFAVQKKNIQNFDHLLLTDFDVALPFYLAKKFNSDINYLYEIRDDFALRYNFPKRLKSVISKIDSKIKNNAALTIHVDESRIRKGDTNFIVIKNTPFDFYQEYTTPNYKLKVAVIGHISNIRGLTQILSFAKDHQEIDFVFAGVQIFNNEVSDIISSLSNIKTYKRMEQHKLFEIINDCSGIFSIYDPSLEINLKAASNKLYDAMMLGIPVIVNREILASEFVLEYDLGFVIDYNHGNSWDELAEKLSNKELVAKIGSNGRKVYENNLDFLTICETKLLPQIEKIEYKV